MNMIFKWAKMIDESININDYNESEQDELKQDRIGISRPSELGKKINSILSKDLYENKYGSAKEFYAANFSCNITDAIKLKEIFHGKMKTDLEPGISYIYFMCAINTLEPQQMVDYINDICGSVLPFKINVDDVKYVGTHRFSPSNRELDSTMKIARDLNKTREIYVVASGRYDPKYVIEKKRKEIAHTLSVIKDDYPESSLMVKYGDINYLTLFLKQIPQSVKDKEMDYDHNYLLMLAKKGSLNHSQQIKIATALLDSAELLSDDDEIEEDDIKNIGIIRGKEKSSGRVFEIDTFLVKVK